MRTFLTLALLAAPAAAQSQIVDVSQPGQQLTPVGGPNTALSVGAGATDDFNRPDSANLGPAWTERLGDHLLASNQGTGTSGFTNHWSTHNTASSDYVSAVAELDFFNQPDGGTEVVYVACTFGSAVSAADNIFVKVQDNSQDGMFDTVFFYRGINGNGWGGVQPVSVPLATPTTQGRMRVSFSPDGDSAICEIDTNSDGTYDELITKDGLLGTGPYGTDIGIGSFGDGAFDNWSLNGGVANSGNAYCFGDGSGAVCPCAAFGGAGEGCMSTSGTGATLTGSGNADTGSDSFQLDVSGAPANKPGLFFQGVNMLSNPAGDGILCSNSSLRYAVNSTDAAGNVTQSGFGANAVTGQTLNYQYWYRDTGNPCGGGFNFSNGWVVTW